MAQLMRTSNPVLNQKRFEDVAVRGGGMTIDGTVNKTGVLLVCAIATAAWTWHLFNQTHSPAAVLPWLWIGNHRRIRLRDGDRLQKRMVSGHRARLCAAGRAGVGQHLGHSRAALPGIAIQSVSLTFGTLLVLLLAYRSGLIPATQNFRLGIVAATGAIMLFYLLQFVLGFFGVHFTSINGSGPIGIGFSLIVVGIAALNLVLDFDFIESGARMGAPKYMEWYGAFGLMVTLVWLYLEILRLLTKLRGRD